MADDNNKQTFSGLGSGTGRGAGAPVGPRAGAPVGTGRSGGAGPVGTIVAPVIDTGRNEEKFSFWKQKGLENYDAKIFNGAPVQYTELMKNSSFINASRLVYEMKHGAGSAAHFTDAEAAVEGIDAIRWFNNNIISTGVTGKQVMFNATDQQKIAFLYLMDTYEHTKMSFDGFKSFLWQGVVTDPATLGSIAAGLFTFGEGTVAAQEGRVAAWQTFKTTLREGVKDATEKVIGKTAATSIREQFAAKTLGGAVLRGAMPGAPNAAATDAIQQGVRMQRVTAEDGTKLKPQQEAFSVSELGISTTVGAGMGGALGGGGEALHVVMPYVTQATRTGLHYSANLLDRGIDALPFHLDTSASTVSMFGAGAFKWGKRGAQAAGEAAETAAKHTSAADDVVGATRIHAGAEDHTNVVDGEFRETPGSTQNPGSAGGGNNAPPPSGGTRVIEGEVVDPGEALVSTREPSEARGGGDNTPSGNSTDKKYGAIETAKDIPWAQGSSYQWVDRLGTGKPLLADYFGVPILGRLARRISDTVEIAKLTPEYMRMGLNPWYSMHNWTKDYFDTVDTLKTANFANLYIGLFPDTAVESIADGSATKATNFVFKMEDNVTPVYDITRSMEKLGAVLSNSGESGTEKINAFSQALSDPLREGSDLARVETTLRQIAADSEKRNAYTSAVERLRSAEARSHSLADAQAQLKEIIASTNDASTKSRLEDAAQQLLSYANYIRDAEDAANAPILYEGNGSKVKRSTSAVPTASEQKAKADSILREVQEEFRSHTDTLDERTADAKTEAIRVLGVLKNRLNQTGTEAASSMQALTDATTALEQDLVRYNQGKSEILADPYIFSPGKKGDPDQWVRKDKMTGGTVVARLALHDIHPHMQVVENFQKNLVNEIGNTGTLVQQTTNNVSTAISEQLEGLSDKVSTNQLLDRITSVRLALTENERNMRNASTGLESTFAKQHANAAKELNTVKEIGNLYTEVRGGKKTIGNETVELPGNIGGALWSGGKWSAKWQIRQATGRVEIDPAQLHIDRFNRIAAEQTLSSPSLTARTIPPSYYGRDIGGFNIDYRPGDTVWSVHSGADGGKSREIHTIEFTYNAASGEMKDETAIKQRAAGVIVENTRNLLLGGKWNDAVDAWKWLGLSYNSGPGERSRGINDIVIKTMNDSAAQIKLAGTVQNPWSKEATAALNFMQKLQFDFGNNAFRDEWTNMNIASRTRFRRYPSYYITEAKHSRNPNEYRSALNYRYWVRPVVLGMWPVHEIPTRIFTKFVPGVKLKDYGGAIANWAGGAAAKEAWNKKSGLGKFGAVAGTVFSGGLNTKIGRNIAASLLVAHLAEEGWELKTGHETNLDLGSRGLQVQFGALPVTGWAINKALSFGGDEIGVNTQKVQDGVTFFTGNDLFRLKVGKYTPFSDRYDDDPYVIGSNSDGSTPTVTTPSSSSAPGDPDFKKSGDPGSTSPTTAPAPVAAPVVPPGGSDVDFKPIKKISSAEGVLGQDLATNFGIAVKHNLSFENKYLVENTLTTEQRMLQFSENKQGLTPVAVTGQMDQKNKNVPTLG